MDSITLGRGLHPCVEGSMRPGLPLVRPPLGSQNETLGVVGAGFMISYGQLFLGVLDSILTSLTSFTPSALTLHRQPHSVGNPHDFCS